MEYAIHNKMAADILDWAKNVRVPDELFFNVLNYNSHLHVPGSSLYSGK